MFWERSNGLVYWQGRDARQAGAPTPDWATEKTHLHVMILHKRLLPTCVALLPHVHVMHACVCAA